MSDNGVNREGEDDIQLGIESTEEELPFGSECLEQAQWLTFSHWPCVNPSRAQMTEAGFFSCNDGDRTICLDCNLICQQWTPFVDNPSEVHKALSPNCPYVTSKLNRRQPPRVVNFDLSSSVNPNNTRNRIPQQPVWQMYDEIELKRPLHSSHEELSKRHASFANWPRENLPFVDDLIRAGFFYRGTGTIVTCFYCNGSLQNWGPNDNPMIEHARWFPQCTYAKQLCGADLYCKIQKSQRAKQERARANELKQQEASTTLPRVTNTTASSRLLEIPDESTLDRLVAARLDLPISQTMLALDFRLSIIRRCWRDQLQLKRLDFVSPYDLFTACLILRKQIEHINGDREKIVVPSVKMREMRQEAEALFASRNMPSSNIPTSNAESRTEGTSPTTNANGQPNKSLTNHCLLCIEGEKRVAFIPCGHLVTCVPCAKLLRSCPICRREIEAFVRIYTG